MSKKLFSAPYIYFAPKPVDDDPGEEDARGSVQAGYNISFEAWMESEWKQEYDGAGGIDELDYYYWFIDQEFGDDTYPHYNDGTEINP